MNDGPQSAASVERLVLFLAAEAVPADRLRLRLWIADGGAFVGARRALAYAQEAREIAASLDDAHAAAESSYLQGQCADLLLDHVTALRAFDAAFVLDLGDGRNRCPARGLPPRSWRTAARTRAR